MIDTNKLIEINKRKGIPRTYRFNRFIRWFTLLMAFFAFSYALWYSLFSDILTTDSKTWHKVVPFVIMFLALNSIIKNLFTLNKVIFKKDRIIFSYLGKKNIEIQWKDMLKMEFLASRRKAIIITFNQGGDKKQFYFGASFPNLLEIINSIVELVPEIELDDFLKKAVITPQEREEYLKKAEFDSSKIDEKK